MTPNSLTTGPGDGAKRPSRSTAPPSGSTASKADGARFARASWSPTRASHKPRISGRRRADFALVRRANDEVVAVEVELTLKNRTRLERILLGYLRNHNVTMVRYHAAPPIADAVQRAARAVGAEAIVELAPLPSTGTSTIRSRS
jgi:hypothetical protein